MTTIVIKDDALIERAFNYEMGWCKRALRKYGEKKFLGAVAPICYSLFGGHRIPNNSVRIIRYRIIRYSNSYNPA